MEAITLTIRLTVPDTQDMDDLTLKQLLIDEYTNYATISHLKDASIWFAEVSKYFEQDNKKYAKGIADRHRMWASICENAEIVEMTRSSS